MCENRISVVQAKLRASCIVRRLPKRYNWVFVLPAEKHMAVPTFNRGRDAAQEAAILKGLSAGEMNLVMSRASRRAAPKGAFIFRQGEPAEEMFLLVAGRIRLVETTAEGREVLVRFVQPGQVFGDRAAIAGSSFGASASCDAPVQVYVWTTKTIALLLREIPALSANLLAITARHQHYARERYRLLATASVSRRIRWALTDLSRSIGVRHRNTTILAARAIQRDIADLAGTTVYTVNRALSGYEQRGILSRERGRIILLRALR